MSHVREDSPIEGEHLRTVLQTTQLNSSDPQSLAISGEKPPLNPMGDENHNNS